MTVGKAGHISSPCLLIVVFCQVPVLVNSYVFCQEPMCAFIDVCFQVAILVNADVFWQEAMCVNSYVSFQWTLWVRRFLLRAVFIDIYIFWLLNLAVLLPHSAPRCLLCIVSKPS